LYQSMEYWRSAARTAELARTAIRMRFIILSLPTVRCFDAKGISASRIFFRRFHAGWRGAGRWLREGVRERESGRPTENNTLHKFHFATVRFFRKKYQRIGNIVSAESEGPRAARQAATGGEGGTTRRDDSVACSIGSWGCARVRVGNETTDRQGSSEFDTDYFAVPTDLSEPRPNPALNSDKSQGTLGYSRLSLRVRFERYPNPFAKRHTTSGGDGDEEGLTRVGLSDTKSSWRIARPGKGFPGGFIEPRVWPAFGGGLLPVQAMTQLISFGWAGDQSARSRR
jgi:hypothetical protein